MATVESGRASASRLLAEMLIGVVSGADEVDQVFIDRAVRGPMDFIDAYASARLAHDRNAAPSSTRSHGSDTYYDSSSEAQAWSDVVKSCLQARRELPKTAKTPGLPVDLTETLGDPIPSRTYGPERAPDGYDRSAPPVASVPMFNAPESASRRAVADVLRSAEDSSQLDSSSMMLLVEDWRLLKIEEARLETEYVKARAAVLETQVTSVNDELAKEKAWFASHTTAKFDASRTAPVAANESNPDWGPAPIPLRYSFPATLATLAWDGVKWFTNIDVSLPVSVLAVGVSTTVLGNLLVSGAGFVKNMRELPARKRQFAELTTTHEQELGQQLQALDREFVSAMAPLGDAQQTLETAVADKFQGLIVEDTQVRFAGKSLLIKPAQLRGRATPGDAEVTKVLSAAMSGRLNEYENAVGRLRPADHALLTQLVSQPDAVELRVGPLVSASPSPFARPTPALRLT